MFIGRGLFSGGKLVGAEANFRHALPLKLSGLTGFLSPSIYKYLRLRKSFIPCQDLNWGPTGYEPAALTD